MMSGRYVAIQRGGDVELLAADVATRQASAVSRPRLRDAF